jgi:hypothetical protein
MLDTLMPGTHLTTPRRGYRHHGIYCGDGRVIHYAGFDRFLQRGPVEEVSLAQFAAGHGYSVQPHVAPRYDAAAVVARARSRLGENRYRLWSNNCEHFAEWCLQGVSRSAQVERHRVRFARMLIWLRVPLSGASATVPARQAA